MGTFAVWNENAEKIGAMLAEAGIQAHVVGRAGSGTTLRVADDKHDAAMKVISLLDTQAEQAGKTTPLWQYAMVLGVGVITLAALGFLPFALLPVTLFVFGAWVVVFVFDTVLYNRAWAKTARAHGAKRVEVGAWLAGAVSLGVIVFIVYVVLMAWLEVGIL
jgi:hypothetical protein